MCNQSNTDEGNLNILTFLLLPLPFIYNQQKSMQKFGTNGRRNKFSNRFQCSFWRYFPPSIAWACARLIQNDKSDYLFKHVRYYSWYYCKRAVKLNVFHVGVQWTRTFLTRLLHFTRTTPWNSIKWFPIISNFNNWRFYSLKHFHSSADGMPCKLFMYIAI